MSKGSSAIRFRTRDPEVALSHLQEHYSAISLGVTTPDRFAFDHSLAGDSLASIGHLAFTGEADSDIEPPSAYLVGHVFDGRMTLTSRRRELDLTRPVLYPRGLSSSAWSDARLGLISLDASEVDRLVRLTVGDQHAHRFMGENPATPKLTADWVRTVRYVNREVFGRPDVLQSAQLRAEAREQLALALLRTFPNSAMEEANPRDSQAVLANLRRAMRYIEENANGTVTVADIADASGYSIRGLQAAFRRDLDMTPLGYLRWVRLDAVHAILRTWSPSDGSIADIARRYGFTHLGRFAVQYRDEFGLSPHQTRDN